MPSKSAIIRSESISSNSSPEVSTASASMPEPACLQAYPAALSIESMISRIGSSSSTTRMRSGMRIHGSLSAIVTVPRDSESNHPGPESPSRKTRPVVFKSEEYLRSQRDERFPLVDLEFGGKAWLGQAHGGRTVAGGPARRYAACPARLPRELPENLGGGLDGIRGLTAGGTLAADAGSTAV